jgi:hypothetical protein
LAASETTEPATSGEVNRLGKHEQLGGELYFQNNPDHQERQALKLARRFGFAFETAVVVASLAWGIAR